LSRLAPKLAESLRLALHTLRSHKMRSGLVILGVGIGVTTLMGMVSILTGLGQKIASDIRSSDHVVVTLTKFDLVVHGDRDQFMSRPDPDPDDLAAIRAELPRVRYSDFQQASQFFTRLQREGQKTGLVSVFGASSHLALIYNIPLILGRNFTDQEELHSGKVVLIGFGPYHDLFEGVDPIGKMVRVRGEEYTVVGVFDKRKSLFGGGFADNFVMLPYTTFRKDLAREGDQISINVVPVDGESAQKVVDDLTALMRARHRLRPSDPDDFSVITADQIEAFVSKVTGPIGLVLAVIASIGLMVGGIGVMAIMLVSVTERTREIGIRKALGASRGDILYQFLVESASLTGIGGLLGIAAGIGLAQAAAALVHLPASVPIGWTLAGAAFSAGIGIVFGLYPALRASRLDPIEAIRME
jgi:putative ABC transport system permease protein